jgi:hypothetical protein
MTFINCKMPKPINESIITVTTVLKTCVSRLRSTSVDIALHPSSCASPAAMDEANPVDAT